MLSSSFGGIPCHSHLPSVFLVSRLSSEAAATPALFSVPCLFGVLYPSFALLPWSVSSHRAFYFAHFISRSTALPLVGLHTSHLSLPPPLPGRFVFSFTGLSLPLLLVKLFRFSALPIRFFPSSVCLPLLPPPPRPSAPACLSRLVLFSLGFRNRCALSASSEGRSPPLWSLPPRPRCQPRFSSWGILPSSWMSHARFW